MGCYAGGVRVILVFPRVKSCSILTYHGCWRALLSMFGIHQAFKTQIGRFAPRFVGYAQQDSQEFLRFLLDGKSWRNLGQKLVVGPSLSPPSMLTLPGWWVSRRVLPCDPPGCVCCTWHGEDALLTPPGCPRYPRFEQKHADSIFLSNLVFVHLFYILNVLINFDA